MGPFSTRPLATVGIGPEFSVKPLQNAHFFAVICLRGNENSHLQT